MTAWVVFYLYDDGTECQTDAIGRSKEQAYSRAKRLFPECNFDSPAWKVRRVTMTWKV